MKLLLLPVAALLAAIATGVDAGFYPPRAVCGDASTHAPTPTATPSVAPPTTTPTPTPPPTITTPITPPTTTTVPAVTTPPPPVIVTRPPLVTSPPLVVDLPLQDGYVQISNSTTYEKRTFMLLPFEVCHVILPSCNLGVDRMVWGRMGFAIGLYSDTTCQSANMFDMYSTAQLTYVAPLEQVRAFVLWNTVEGIEQRTVKTVNTNLCPS